jgi:hypothetical protein
MPTWKLPPTMDEKKAKEILRKIYNEAQLLKRGASKMPEQGHVVAWADDVLTLIAAIGIGDWHE